MKISKLFSILLFIPLFISCVDEEVINPDASFAINNQNVENTEYTCYVGETFYIVKKGNAEFLSLFDGTAGKIWGESGSLGVQFQLNDSLPVTYSSAGEFSLTVVASSSAKFGDDFLQNTKTVKIKVIDRRNSLSDFSLLILGIEYKAVIDGLRNVTISIPDVYKDSVIAVKPLFVSTSSGAEVFVNSQKQTSGVSVQNLSGNVVYKVVAPNGDYLEFPITVNYYAASSQKAILQFRLVTGGIYGNGEEGVIDEVNKTISINLNYGTPAEKVKVELTASVSSNYLYNGTTAFATYSNLTSAGSSPLKTIKVIAQDQSEATYSVVVSYEAAFKSFTFKGFNPSPISVIDNTAKTITLKVLKGTDITKLVAEWNGTVGKVNIGTTKQVNGTTPNDFSLPKQYKLYKGNTFADTYTVSVLVLE